MTIEYSQRQNLVPGIRASLNAKFARLLARPLIARVATSSLAGHDAADGGAVPAAFRSLLDAASKLGPPAASAWREDPEDGTSSVRILIDYDDTWHGYERDVREMVSGAVESAVTFLTNEQKTLLETSPRAFLQLSPRPETAELVAFEEENVGGSVRVVGLRLASAPQSRAHIQHVAIVPNLVQIERQLDALDQIEKGSDDGPLAPLRVLVGLGDTSRLAASAARDVDLGCTTGFDEHQVECVRKAIATPHIAVIEGPPGSGKTTVITAIVQSTLARGERVLVVSPTHVAVDNVVEKLLPKPDATDDLLHAWSLPVRYAARGKKLSTRAMEYWVGARKQRRGAAIARRVENRLIASVPVARALFALEDTSASGHAPISSAFSAVESVICGTPIGILSYDHVKNAEAGSFGVLIVDEVSKMTLSEFLAIAVKARRWVVVGDPAQLPPFNDSEENATTLDDIIPPLVEIACSVGAVLERAKPRARRDERLVVIASDPVRARNAISAHVRAVFDAEVPSVGVVDDAVGAGIIVCTAADEDRAYATLASSGGTEPRLLVERGIRFGGNGRRTVPPRERAQAAIFENAFNIYHAQPWSSRTGQRLPFLGFRNGLAKYLPTPAALGASFGVNAESCSSTARAMAEAIALRFAINTISVYDWLTGIPAERFDTSPLTELATLSCPKVRDAVRPFVGRLKKQYRMHSTLSRVPRDLFYFGEALHDGRDDTTPGSRVTLLQVAAGRDDRESNVREVDAICGLIERLSAGGTEAAHRTEVMVITPYREQESRFNEALEALGRRGSSDRVNVDVCTLDRCQGREAEYVLISLVRSRATTFFDMPKRWNVALTRAREGLVIVGDVEAYLDEARTARGEVNGSMPSGRGRLRPGETRPRMSLLARVIESYDDQIRGIAPRRDPGAVR